MQNSQRLLNSASNGSDGAAYGLIQGTRPQTLEVRSCDSPVGQAMWIYEKFRLGATTKVIPRRRSRSITCWMT